MSHDPSLTPVRALLLDRAECLALAQFRTEASVVRAYASQLRAFNRKSLTDLLVHAGFEEEDVDAWLSKLDNLEEARAAIVAMLPEDSPLLPVRWDRDGILRLALESHLSSDPARGPGAPELRNAITSYLGRVGLLIRFNKLLLKRRQRLAPSSLV